MLKNLWSKIKAVNHQAKEQSGLLFYTKPQTYSVTYSVVVTNNSLSEKKIPLIIPLPLDKGNQKLHSDPTYVPNAEIKKEERFDNRFAQWSVSLAAKQSTTVKMAFDVKVLPINVTPNYNFSLTDYKQLNAVVKDKYCTANQYCPCDNSVINNLAHDICKNETNVWKIISKLNSYVIKKLHYGNPISGLYSATDALDKKKVDCGGFDTLLGSLCMALGIPTRIVAGFFAGYENNTMHAWLEILLPDGSWVPADPSMEQLRNLGQTRKSGKIGSVGSDRIAFSHGCCFIVNIDSKAIKLDILQNPFIPYAITDIDLKVAFKTQRK